MKKRICAIVLAIAVAAVGFSGCGKSKYDPGNFLPSGTSDNPYRIVKNRVAVKIFVPRGASNPHFNDMKMFKKLSEITGLDFDFTEVDTSAYDQVRSAVWEDKANLPDLFLFNNSISEQVYYGDLGAFCAFNDPELVTGGVRAGHLIDNYMPTYKALLENNFGIDTDENAVRTATCSGGKMWSALSVNNVPRDLTFKMFINQKWIENLREDGYTLPDAADIRTVEQYEQVLRAFKSGDPNRNGKADEIPVASRSLEYLRNFILASYGYVFPDLEVKNDGSGIVYVPATEEYRRYLDTMARWDADGLLDPATFSIKTDAQLAQKGMEHRLGSFCSAAAYLVAGMKYESEYVTFGPLTSASYAGEPLQWGFPHFSPTGATIPAGTPYVREIARLLDIMYGELGQQLIGYGEENADWAWDDETRSSWTFRIPEGWAGTQEDYRATLTPNVGTGSALFWNYGFVGKMNDPIIKKLNAMSEIYAPYLKVPVPSDIKLTVDEYNESEQIYASLSPFLENEEYQFIKEKKATQGAPWDKYLSDLNKYKVERYTKIYNAAYLRRDG
ncbi:MAG: hypothetical protein LBP26_03190 [Clostridiales bacterium]|jgi:putative aldouronate transport system substrate-binding protein|nr:hypothetical protein [Clostridiales bacterium]